MVSDFRGRDSFGHHPVTRRGSVVAGAVAGTRAKVALSREGARKCRAEWVCETGLI